MAKFSLRFQLSPKEREELLIDFCESLASLKSTKEAAQFITDLLSKAELDMVAKRLRIAEMLINGSTYEEIKKRLRVSTNTIARVNIWLQNAGEGYRMVVERTRNKRKMRHEVERPARIRALKRKYPLHYWPTLLLEQIVQNASRREKEQLRLILKRVGQKHPLYKHLNSLLKDF